MMEHLISMYDVPPQTLEDLLKVSLVLKLERRTGSPSVAAKALDGKTVALMFEKPSLRTRVTFEVAIGETGGRAVYLGKDEVGLGKRESIGDVARNISRWVHALVIRTFAHANVVDMAYLADVPVINALTDYAHPCQALADIMTVLEVKKSLKGATLAWVGDGNNVCHSLLNACSKTGMHIRVATPQGYEPNQAVVEHALAFAAESGGSVKLFVNPKQAVEGADAVYTDVWASMGQETEASERMKIFQPYQVNGALMKLAKKDAIFLHCLPAKRGQEVTDEVLDGPRSLVVEQAENRLHTAKAVLLACMAPQIFSRMAARRITARVIKALPAYAPKSSKRNVKGKRK